MSPREVFDAAMAAPPLSEFELMQKRCADARERARAEARRQPSPQLPLEQVA
jgi:hypothetical protein